MNILSTYKKIIVLGAAESGIGAALLAQQKGHDVFVSDAGTITQERKTILSNHNILFEECGHNLHTILKASAIIKSPGIANNNEIIIAARKQGIIIMSEIDFAYCYKGKSKIIAITGSNGKSTTTSLIYHIINKHTENVALVGNIGYSFAKQIADNPKDYYVLEVSSFQLDDIHFFKPDVAILLNLSEDHLDRYDESFQNYINAKFNISKFQQKNDVFIYNHDDENIVNNISKYSIHAQITPFSMKQKLHQGAYLDKTEMVFSTEEEQLQINFEPLPLQGKHNHSNMLAAGLTAKVMGIRNNFIREAMQTFKGLEHRMEAVATVRDVLYINDSKATNINSTWYALESMTKKTVLILGGKDKGNDYNIIKNLVEQKVSEIICIGKNNTKIIQFFKNIVPTHDTDSMQNAVKLAYKISKRGEVVLLSPACASFDLFINFEDRGLQFKQQVKNL